MRVLLVFPPSRVGGCFRGDPELWPPLGILYLAAVLEREGHTVEVIDSTILTESQYEARVTSINADMVGISASFGQIKSALSLAEKMKDRRIPVVVGGPGPSSMDPGLFLKRCTYVVQGEGEETFIDIARHIEAGEMPPVPGSFTYVEGRTVCPGERPLITDVDGVPFPAREKLPIARYLDHWRSTYPKTVTSVLSSRGCPFHCSFCSKTVFGRKFRARSAKNLTDELLIIEEMGFDRVWFVDDLFVHDRKRVREICRTIKKERIDLEWACQARVESVNSELLSLMKSSGLICIAFGVESGSKKIIDWYNKGFTLAQCRTVFSLCHHMNVATHAYFIVGAPVETSHDIELTKAFIKEINPTYALFSVLTPYPGTPVYSQYAPSSDLDELDDAKKSVIVGQEHAEKKREEMEEFYAAFKAGIGEKPLLLGEI
ncbi:MAG: cobalamin B12-binding domain-containing protein [Theionarchaea archaeon]|nr:cobalamin B12-binding domain-containing protein [Theionarchaea archaeon]MBU7038676.1 cobalamin B12-binding domain-containing protein [Theionarchaea archaeon]